MNSACSNSLNQSEKGENSDYETYPFEEQTKNSSKVGNITKNLK